MNNGGLIKGVISLVSDLKMSISPEAATIKKMSQFNLQVLKRTEYFYAAPLPPLGGVASSSADGTFVRGRKAIMDLYHRYEKAVDSKEGNLPTADDLKPFKVYRWVLGDAQTEKVRQWLITAAQHASKNSKGDGAAAPKKGMKGICNDDDLSSGCDIVPAKRPLAASAGTSSQVGSSEGNSRKFFRCKSHSS